MFRVTQCPCSRDISYRHHLQLHPLSPSAALWTSSSRNFTHIQHRYCKADFLGLSAWLYPKYCYLSLTVWEQLIGSYTVKSYCAFLNSSVTLMNFWSSCVNLIWDLLNSLWCMCCPNGPGYLYVSKNVIHCCCFLWINTWMLIQDFIFMVVFFYQIRLCSFSFVERLSCS